MSKLRVGQNLEIGTKKYRITRAKNKNIRCRVCQEHNKCVPCVNPDPTVDNPIVWTTKDCHEKLPDNAYLHPY
jgi:hypothetical protein